MKKQTFLFIFLLIGVIAVSLACSLFSGISEKISETKSTAGAVATDVQQGQQVFSTAKAFATEFGDSNFMSTAKALATEAKDSGYLETAQAYITSEAPGAVETLQAFTTEQGPSLLQTGQAYVTEISQSSGDLPSDIPVVSGEKSMFYASQELVSYFTSEDFQSVLTFYKKEMPNNGWTKYDQGWVENSNSAVIYFEKSDRSVSVTLSINPVDNKTIVMVTITPK
jgi:hypothetical protein